jgi:hypothetical protein
MAWRFWQQVSLSFLSVSSEEQPCDQETTASVSGAEYCPAENDINFCCTTGDIVDPSETDI